jgi:hypothetical protein
MSSVADPEDQGCSQARTRHDKRHRRLIGCPRGCPLGRHELPCLVGEPIDVVIDYLDSGTFVAAKGGVRLIALRQVAA